MKHTVYLFTLLLIVVFPNGYSQISILRYNDNFSYLKSDTVKKNGIEKIKHMPLAKEGNISFGGDLREQLQYYKNINFGDGKTSHSNTIQLWHRLMLHSNLEIGKKVRLFTQLGSTFRFFNPDPLTPEIDQNKLSLHQAFVDYYYSKKWQIRIGRQEVTYGNNRILTFREGPNTRQTFDAAAVRYNSEGRRLDMFVMSPVISKPGVFDDERSREVVAGIYGTEKPHLHVPGLDYYVLNYSGNRRMYNFSSGNEMRQSYGFRLFSKNDRFNYELEGTYQSGKFNDLRISAFSVSADVSHVVVAKQLTLGLAGNYASGDKGNSDMELNTYNFLFSRPQYGLTAPIGASNIVNINPYLSAMPAKRMRIDAGAYFMWRASIHDGTYSPLAKEVRPAPAQLFNATQKKIGTLLSLEAAFVVAKNISMGVDAGYFIAGNYTKETGKGRNISYYSFKTSVKL